MAVAKIRQTCKLRNWEYNHEQHCERCLGCINVACLELTGKWQHSIGNSTNELHFFRYFFREFDLSNFLRRKLIHFPSNAHEKNYPNLCVGGDASDTWDGDQPTQQRLPATNHIRLFIYNLIREKNNVNRFRFGVRRQRNDKMENPIVIRHNDW